MAHRERMSMISRILAVPILGLLAFSARAEGTLFEQIGGADTLKAVVDDFTDIVMNDDRINFTFADAKLDKFKELLYNQICELTAGPCKYNGRDMRTTHEKLKIDNSQFNALAEDLYIAFDHKHVPYRVQNKVMALLAPMQRDIVK
jgi:hemoglobin